MRKKNLVNFIAVLIVVLISYLEIFCFKISKEESKEEKMDDKMIEELIKRGDGSILDPENLAKIEKKEYPFIGKYIHSSNNDVKRDIFYFLNEINQPWCYKWYKIGLEDKVGHIRVKSGKGILKLKNVGTVKELLQAIEKEHTIFPGKEYATPYLIKAIGNIGDKSDIERLIKVVESIQTDELIMKDIREALDAALTKLGDVKTVQMVERKLTMGTPEEKMEALGIVEYTEDKRWIPYVVPLLLDESVAMSYEFGPVIVKKLVCDFAANTLLVIDKEKKLDIEPLGGLPYKKEEIEKVRKIYGLIKEEK